MNDVANPFPDDEPDLPATYQLSDNGWEEVDYVEPGTDWTVTDDGAYESPDGRTRTRPVSEPVEWSDRPSA